MKLLCPSRGRACWIPVKVEDYSGVGFSDFHLGINGSLSQSVTPIDRHQETIKCKRWDS